MRLYGSNGAYDVQRRIFTYILDILTTIGWPQRYPHDKILADCLAS
jgi:hypothetical protein